MKKVKTILVVLLSLLLLISTSACGLSEAKAAYKPPARVFDVEIEGTSEPKIDGVEITYDSKARIDTVSYSIDGYDYKQEYSYDTDQIVIKTIYKTEVIEEKVIKYVDIPVESGFVEVDGYIVRVTEDMPVESNSGNDSANKETEKPKATEAPTKKPTEKQTEKTTTSSSERILSEYINKSRSDLVSEFGNNYSSVEIPGSGLTDNIRFESLSDVVFGISAETDHVIIVYCANPEIYLVKGIRGDMTISELRNLGSGDFTVEEYDLEIDGTHNFAIQYNDGFRVSFVWNGDYSDTLADYCTIQNTNYLV